MKLRACLREAERSLRAHRIDVPELTARVLLAHVLQRDQPWLVSHSEDHVDEKQREEYAGLVRARCEGVPTQYLRGIQEFYGIEIGVTPDVLIPRPETEHLVEAAIRRLLPGHRVVDIGTGSGAVAIAIAKHAPPASVTASDMSAKAIAVARANAQRVGCEIRFCLGDLGMPFADRHFDIVVSNPPYVPLSEVGSLQRELRHEPSMALFGGEDGLQVVRRLADETPRILKPGGWLLVEIGYRARDAVEGMLDRAEWELPEFLPDLAGIDRVVAVQRSSA